MKNYILIGAVIILVLGLSYFFYQDSSILTPSITEIQLEPVSVNEVRLCNSDNDCVIVKDTQHCCHCPTIINKKYIDYWNEIAIDCSTDIEMLCKCALINFATCENNECKPNY